MQFFLYVLAGGAATLMHYSVLVALVETASFDAAPAAVVGALCGALVGFVLNHKLTFAANSARARRAFVRFMATAAAGAIASGAVVWLCVHLLNWYYLVAQIVATMLLLVITYQINRRWSFVE